MSGRFVRRSRFVPAKVALPLARDDDAHSEGTHTKGKGVRTPGLKATAVTPSAWLRSATRTRGIE